MAEPTARIDPLERETPRSAMIGFLKYALREYDESKKKDVVAHVAASGYDARGYACRLQIPSTLCTNDSDDRMLHVVLVLMLITATLGPVLRQKIAPRMVEDSLAGKLNGRGQ